MKVPEHEKDYFSEMPPIFKNTQITIDDIGPFMKNLCKQVDEFKTPHLTLISKFFGEQIMITLQLLRWYMSHGLEFENNTAFIKYNPVACCLLMETRQN